MKRYHGTDGSLCAVVGRIQTTTNVMIGAGAIVLACIKIGCIPPEKLSRL